MSSKDKQQLYTYFWFVAFLMMVAWWVFFQPQVEDQRFLKSVRKSGKYSIYANDTTYVFKVKIDSQYYDPLPVEEPEPR
ncbi:hypothetical protein [Mucilaginibacter pedocola]|uniref:Uncharacterized protein n=1 Tax=Mucilaginibacter pedocola TaxID=1792845 RepID=A0A1S9PMB9_9SPHI|nr:hypothetical protein [Mucilaginibacter pedocola]OOQ62110.1 hypothetical protein BC343_03410 [Mucilaginibacter pedocola]